MFYRIIILVGLILVCAAGQISLLGGLPWAVSLLNLPLLLLLFLILTSENYIYLWLAWTAGFCLDAVSFLPFGLYSTTYLASALAGQVLLKHFFTNRSLYTFAVLGALTILFFNLFFFLLRNFISLALENFQFFLTPVFWLELGLSAIVNGLAMVVVFYGYHFFPSRFSAAGRKKAIF